MDEFFKIVGGVFFGGLMALLAHDAIQEARLEYAAKQAAVEFRQSLVENRQRADRERQTRLQQEQLQTTSAQQQQALRQRAVSDARRASQTKEQAFERYFAPSQTCRTDPTSVDCGNAHIRARQQFERAYVPS